MQLSQCPRCGPLTQKLPADLVELVHAIALKAAVPLPMALSLVINATTAAAQRTMAIRLPDGGIETIQRIDLVVSEPESGKNTAFRQAFASLRAFDKEVNAIREAALRSGQALPERVVLLRSEKMSDLIEVIARTQQSTNIVLLDGGALLNSRYFQTEQHVTCDLWDGETRVSMRDQKSKLRTATDPAVSFLAMPQVKRMLDYLALKGEDAIAGGLLQRCSITWPSSCYHAPAHCNKGRIAEYDKIISNIVGDPATFVSGGVQQLIGVPLSHSAEERYLHLLEQQMQARMAGHPGPWRALQKALRTSLPIQLLMSGFHDARFQQLRPLLELSSCGQDKMIRAAGKPFEISLEAFEAALAYVNWQHAQMDIAALAARPSSSIRVKASGSLPALKLSTVEKRRLRTREDMDEIMRKLDEHSDRLGHHLGVPRSDLLTRVGVYRQRFDTAVASLSDEGYLIEGGKGKSQVLTRTTRRYFSSSPYPFASSSGFGVN